MHTRSTLSADLRSLGVADGDVVMVHASVRAIGEIAGGPDEIHLAIKDAITADGTLFMYAGCPQYVDEVGRGNLSPEEEAEVLEKLPAFDAETARCDRSHGALAEFFRTYIGTRVNQHVARFAAWGKNAEYLLSPQPWDFAYGRGSIFERFVALDGKILLLGSDHDNVTFLHHAEHIVDVPNKRVALFKVPVMENGERVWRDMKEFDTSQGVHDSFPATIFSDVVGGHLLETGNAGGKMGDASSYVIGARALLDSALAVMKRLVA
ncbi:MAG: AAC(3) family N-acetyltransferase [bacterium]